MEQIRNYEWAQEKLDALFGEGEHEPQKAEKQFHIPGENRAQRRARERAERKAEKRGGVKA